MLDHQLHFENESPTLTMEELRSRPLTRRRAANEQSKQDNVKRVRSLTECTATPSPNCIVIEQPEIKTEHIQIKTEPEHNEMELDKDNSQVIIKDEVEVSVLQEELDVSDGSIESSFGRDLWTCVEELGQIKEALDEQTHSQGNVIESMKNTFDSEIRDLTTKFEGEQEILKQKLQEKDIIIGKLKEKIKQLEQELAGRESNQTYEDVPSVSDNVPSVPHNAPEDVDIVSSQKSMDPDKRVTKLLAEVMNVLWEKYLNPRKDGNGSFFLNCRLVCKDWRNWMPVCFLEEDPRRRKIDQNAYFPSRMQRWLSMDTRNPFPPTTLTFQETRYFFKNAAVLAEYRNSLQTFLERFGSNIKTFSCDIDYTATRSFSSLEDWYSTFCHWLELMPNLRSLTLEEHASVYDHPHLQTFSMPLAELVRLTPTPQLAHLTRLETIGRGFSESLLLSIFTRHRSIQNCDWEYESRNSSSPNAEFENYVKNTSIENPFSENLAAFRIKVCTHNNFLLLCSMKNVPLQRLDVSVYKIITGSSATVKDVFKVVEAFQYLKCLQISFAFSCKPQPLNMPGLQDLTLTASGRRTAGRHIDQYMFRLISPLLNLQVLRINNVNFEDVAWYPRGGNGFTLCRALVRRSLQQNLVQKLWDHFPNLNFAEIGCGYEISWYKYVFIRKP